MGWFIGSSGGCRRDLGGGFVYYLSEWFINVIKFLIKYMGKLYIFSFYKGIIFGIYVLF